MRIIIANKYYYIDGGPERYMFGLSDYLRSQGHEVIPFAVDYDQNEPSEYQRYFVHPAGSGASTKLTAESGGLGAKFRIAARAIYSIEAKHALERLISDTSPDIVYCLNIVNHLSPSVIDAAMDMGVPVVLRLSDYYLMCASYLFLRDGRICTDCARGFHHALLHNCVHGSRTATITRVAAMYVRDMFRIYRKAGAYVTTTKFMGEMLLRYGYPAAKIHHIPTFVDASKWIPRYDNDGYILYFGRLSPEKGLDYLIEAYNETETADPLVIVGDGPDDYVDCLKSIVAEDKRSMVTFSGKKSGEQLRDVVGGAKYVVVPSLWHDNAPNVVYESFGSGKPVIASALGGLKEQVTEDVGMLVTAGDPEQLSQAMSRLSGEAELVGQMGRAARAKVETEHRIEDHVDKLLGLFDSLIAESKRKSRPVTNNVRG